MGVLSGCFAVVLRYVVAVVALATGLCASAFVALLTGMYLYEGESGLDRLSHPITVWHFALSMIFGVAGISLFRSLLRRRAISWWLLTAATIPMVFATLLAFVPAD